VKPLAALANSLWIAGSVPASRRFMHALTVPADAQAQWLRSQLARHATSEFGRAHNFPAVSSAREFANAVPLSDATELAHWIPRIQVGERNLLTCDAVTHLAPTSGSSGARKLIPFTRALQSSFSAAVSAWMVDLVRQRPALLGGPAYWSVSPLTDDAITRGDADAVPVGFADDAEYLGGWATPLVRQALAVPSSVRHVCDVDAFRALTLLAMLRQRELRLISVWHPSFLELLVSSASVHWDALLAAIESGDVPWLHVIPVASRTEWRARGDAARARELRRIGPGDWPRWWPMLQVVSCWGDQAATAGHAALVRRLPGVLVQSKGLLATEAVLTVPLHGAYPLAVTSHFFEFIATDGNVRLAHELEAGDEYEVVVTNGAGLWRYRLGDVVECTGHLGATPSLRFLGRAGNVSDLRGEKLAEPFVAECLRALWGDTTAPRVAELHAVDGMAGAWYELRVAASGATLPGTELESRLERLLCQNPHYALARRLGQLSALRVLLHADSEIGGAITSRGMRLGDVKPRTLIAVRRAQTEPVEEHHG
jgi:GH3 auxin-responsive promoter